MGKKTTHIRYAKIDHTNQPCIKALEKGRLSLILKKELDEYIARNLLDENFINPCCLKAHLLVTARKMGYSDIRLNNLMKLFRSKLGHNGFYLDAGKLRII